jgi:hypothetical protein
MLGIITARLWDFVTWLFGWRSAIPDGSVIGFKMEKGEPVYVVDSLPAEGLLSYVLEEDEESIYVPEGVEEQAAASLNATVESNTWSFKEGNQVVQRQRKNAPVEGINNQVAIVKWVDWAGFKCTTVEASARRPKILKLYKQVGRDWHGRVRYKMVSKYKVIETGDYCLTSRREPCRIGFREVTGEFKERERGGRWRWRTRTRLIGKCST